jgi:hypothetical protein
LFIRSVAGWGWPGTDILQANKNEWRLKKSSTFVKSFSALMLGAEFKHVVATLAGLSPRPVDVSFV